MNRAEKFIAESLSSQIADLADDLDGVIDDGILGDLSMVLDDPDMFGIGDFVRDIEGEIKRLKKEKDNANVKLAQKLLKLIKQAS